MLMLQHKGVRTMWKALVYHFTETLLPKLGSIFPPPLSGVIDPQEKNNNKGSQKGLKGTQFGSH